ncbi:hypothetical protein CHARACLAT_033614 [Characodon lateralis]|uniref:Uncharacterized protein n=1 Tax=Characodon lateralis TaxID=208331 RepID=A0ABU7EF26_9TELE|nr:hypothetical protein [Characodon lateralis]
MHSVQHEGQKDKHLSHLTRAPFYTHLLCPLNSSQQTTNKISSHLVSATAFFLPHFLQGQISGVILPPELCISAASAEFPRSNGLRLWLAGQYRWMVMFL